MEREVPWKELAAASDAVHAAVNDWTREQTPRARDGRRGDACVCAPVTAHY